MVYCVMAPKLLSNPTRTTDLVKLCGIYIGVMSQRMPKVLVCIMSFTVNSKFITGTRDQRVYKDWYLSVIRFWHFAHHQWLKHEHLEDLTKHGFVSIPVLFLLVLAYYDIQSFYHRSLNIVFGDYINRHHNQSTYVMWSWRTFQNINHMRLPSGFRMCTNVYGYSSK